MAVTSSIHPDNDRAVVALSRVTAAWDWLDVSLEPGPATTGRTVLSDAHRARLDRLARAERADRHATIQAGYTPDVPSPAPLRIAVLDAQVAVLDTIVNCAWWCTSALRARGPMLAWTPYGEAPARFRGAASYLNVAVRLVSPQLAAEVAGQLDQADRSARAAAGVGPDRRALGADCPACGRRALEAEIGPVDQREWYITCRRDCRCQGINCGCRLPLRYAGMAHIWPSRRFPELAELLRRLEVPA